MADTSAFFFFVFFIFVTGNYVNTQKPNEAERIRSPTLEVLMRIPSVLQSTHYKRLKAFNEENIPRSFVNKRAYEISPWINFEPDETPRREKRDATEVNKENPVSQQLSSLPEGKFLDQDAVPSMTDALRGSPYSPFSGKNFDEVDFSDLGHQRRRRNESTDSREDNSQRDKRTFVDGGGGEGGEVTTVTPYWKKKKENPQFITGRGSTPKGNDYSPPQHRSLENARESHSMKNLETTVQVNEVGRSNQDNYYSPTNRRTYSRQTDSVTSSTPKSVYDTLDFSNNKKNQELGREYREGSREGRLTHENYKNRPYTYNNQVHDNRPYYHVGPFPSEIVGRGVEYYHRAYEPTNGRIVYYANMPERQDIRSFDYRYPEPINSNFYMNRPNSYEPQYTNYVPPYDYNYGYNGNGMVRPADYMRTGRSNSQVYSYPYQERNKYQRDPRFLGGYDKGNQIHDDVKNKTYIIYDADDIRFAKPQYPSDIHRSGFGTPFSNSPGSQENFRRFSMTTMPDYYYPSEYPLRNQVYPSRYLGSSWSSSPSQGIQVNSKWPIISSVNPNFRPFNSPHVQLPLTTVVNRNSPYRDLEKINKKA